MWCVVLVEGHALLGGQDPRVGVDREVMALSHVPVHLSLVSAFYPLVLPLSSSHSPLPPRRAPAPTFRQRLGGWITSKTQSSCDLRGMAAVVWVLGPQTRRPFPSVFVFLL